VPSWSPVITAKSPNIRTPTEINSVANEKRKLSTENTIHIMEEAGCDINHPCGPQEWGKLQRT
jgi:hypothetical protein